MEAIKIDAAVETCAQSLDNSASKDGIGSMKHDLQSSSKADDDKKGGDSNPTPNSTPFAAG